MGSGGGCSVRLSTLRVCERALARAFVFEGSLEARALGLTLGRRTTETMADLVTETGAFSFPCGAQTSVKIASEVVISILDTYVRRNEGQERGIGTLLGTVSEGGKGNVSSDALIQEFYGQDTVHVVVDVTLPLDAPI